MSRCLKLCSTTCAGLICAVSNANAGIVCKGDFQIVDGMSISTPYCQDENLAANQRFRGVKISGVDVRRHPEIKRQACATASTANEAACIAYEAD